MEDCLIALHLLGRAALGMKDIMAARDYLVQRLTLCLEHDRRDPVPTTLARMAELATLEKRDERGALLAGACVRLIEASGIPPLGDPEQEGFDRSRIVLQNQLEAECFEKAWSQGHSLSYEETVAVVLASRD